MKLDYEKISRIVLFTLRLQEGTPSTPVSRIKVKIYFKIMNLFKRKTNEGIKYTDFIW